MAEDKYNQPERGEEEWDIPLNENFRDLGIDVISEVDTVEDLPEPDADYTSSNGETRKYLVRESRVVYRDVGDRWQAVAGLGSSENPVSETVYHESHSTEEQIIGGRRLFIQESEPTDAEEGDVWIDIS